ncbi:lipoprotein signal peptidase [Neisseria weixii]|uniref:Lipoprotein signal peptidase n=1 Tax=Neisseria weixii TaxID=1853276 RepID=A0A3N4N637_9NEIS|nr:lipoprotein signal peptidase [Neisseria weixii]RPD87454.1 lipoprotein signal peptidase [Neisseria weixii]
MRNPYLWYISSLCAARKLAYLHDMPSLSVLLQLQIALKSKVQRCRPFTPNA